MKTVVRAALICLLSLSHVATSQPDKDWWACQYIESAGLYWEGNKWKVTRFNFDKPFVLVSDGYGSLTTDSVNKTTGHTYSCRTGSDGNINCQTKMVGMSLSFSPANQRGVMTKIYGALTTPDGEYRDTLSVAPFECAKG